MMISKTNHLPQLDSFFYNFKSKNYVLDNGTAVTSIDLELSRKCNLRCKYCYADSGMALDNELTLDEIKDLITEAKKSGLKSVTIIGGGEPFLVEYLDDLINFIHNNKLHCAIVTNGTLINEKRAKFLFTKQVALCIKMNSVTEPQVFDDMVGGIKGTFEKVHKTIKLLLKLGYSNNGAPGLAVETVVCSDNIKQISEIWRWAREKNILPIVELMTHQGRARNNNRLLVSKEEGRNLFYKLSDIDKKEYGLSWEPMPSIAASPCRRIYYSCYITSVGEVLPCAGIGLSLGNIRKNCLEEIILESQLLKRLRNPHLYLKGKCSKCEFKNNCYGCRGKAFCHTKDPLAEDPFCWR